MHLLNLIITLLPAMVANMTPVILSRLEILPLTARPIDGGRYLGGSRLLGDNKTWRGFVGGIVLGLVMSYVLLAIHRLWTVPLGLFDEDMYLARSFLMSFGALSGDVAESFVKRRMHIPPGTAWFPYDYIDFPVGAILFSGMYVLCAPTDLVWLLVLAACFTPVFNAVMHRWDIKQAL